MHYFQFLLIFKINQTCPVSFPYPHSKKSKKIPQTSQYGLTAGSNPHIIYSVCAIQCRLHDALSQHSRSTGFQCLCGFYPLLYIIGILPSKIISILSGLSPIYALFKYADEQKPVRLPYAT